MGRLVILLVVCYMVYINRNSHIVRKTTAFRVSKRVTNLHLACNLLHNFTVFVFKRKYEGNRACIMYQRRHVAKLTMLSKNKHVIGLNRFSLQIVFMPLVFQHLIILPEIFASPLTKLLKEVNWLFSYISLTDHALLPKQSITKY